MALDLMQHVRARTRSVHFDRGLLFMASSPLAESSPKTSRDSKRTISLPLGPDDEMLSPPSSPRPSTVRHYRSMLDVDTQDPPTLSPMKPMSFDELYIDAVPNETIADTSAQYGKFDSKDITRRELYRSDRRDTSSHYSTSQAPPRASTLHSITFQPSFRASFANLGVNSFSWQRISGVGPFSLACQW
jgi:hypothetical protein